MAGNDVPVVAEIVEGEGNVARVEPLIAIKRETKYSPDDLAKSFDCSPDTLIHRQEGGSEAQLWTPARGKRNFRYSHSQRQHILEEIRDTAGESNCAMPLNVS